MKEELYRSNSHSLTRKPPTPRFFESASTYNDSLQRTSEKPKEQNTISVANCIRALNTKILELANENKFLKESNSTLQSELTRLKSEINNKKIESAKDYKEKCAILEQSNDLFQKKIVKLEENLNRTDKLKSEFVLINKELNKEIEANETAKETIEKLEIEKSYLQSEIVSLKSRINMMADGQKENYDEQIEKIDLILNRKKIQLN